MGSQADLAEREADLLWGLLWAARYEAHLDRGLYKALHELQRLRAARRGEAAGRRPWP